MNEELFIEKVLKLEEDVGEIKETMATKTDVHTIMDTLDDMKNILERLDQERLMTNVRLGRHET